MDGREPTGDTAGPASDPPAARSRRTGAPNRSCRNRSWAGSVGIDVAPEVMKALTKVDPTYRDHALTELRDRLDKYRPNELLGHRQGWWPASGRATRLGRAFRTGATPAGHG
jgi:hypothetical protein